MLGEHAGEKRRHMLHDNYGNREIGRQGRNHFTKCVRSTGRGTDRDDIDAPLNGSDVLQTFEGFDQFAVKFFPILASRRDRSQHLADPVTTSQQCAADLGCEREGTIPQFAQQAFSRMSQRLRYWPAGKQTWDRSPALPVRCPNGRDSRYFRPGTPE
jgi:hypothetical protein